ncbi:MAG: DUF4129 domain-containing protein [Actinomycetota bacterium]
MIASRTAPAPEARELRACALAALAEGGVLYLPVHLVLTESRGLDIGVGAMALPFLAAFVGGAALACRFRASSNVATGGAIAAVLAGILVGGGDVNTSAFAVVTALLVALRVVTLGLRDWRSPIHAEIGWGAVAVGFEAMIAASAEPDWGPLLVVIVPTFFVASLASRATTVWTSGGVHDLDEQVRASWIRRAVLATGALVGAMALAVVLSVRGGVFDRIGRTLTPAAEALVVAFAWLLGQAARPVFWLVDRLGIDPETMREFLERLRAGGLGDREDVPPGETALWQRLLGLLVFAALAYGVYRVLRRSRAHVSAESPSNPRVAVTTTPLAEDVETPHRPAFRRELPADAVRRLYAEALLALARADVPKEPALTPAEFAPEVAEAFPTGTEDFVALTRAYEDVRYGSLRLTPERIRDLEREQKRLLAALRVPAPDR